MGNSDAVIGLHGGAHRGLRQFAARIGPDLKGVTSRGGLVEVGAVPMMKMTLMVKASASRAWHLATGTLVAKIVTVSVAVGVMGATAMLVDRATTPRWRVYLNTLPRYQVPEKSIYSASHDDVVCRLNNDILHRRSWGGEEVRTLRSILDAGFPTSALRSGADMRDYETLDIWQTAACVTAERLRAGAPIETAGRTSLTSMMIGWAESDVPFIRMQAACDLAYSGLVAEEAPRLAMMRLARDPDSEIAATAKRKLKFHDDHQTTAARY